MTQTRTAGRFATEVPRDTRAIYRIVKEVALRASENDPDRFPFPDLVTQPAFDLAAGESDLVERFGYVATARALCAQLPDSYGRPIAWQRLLDAIFREGFSEEMMQRTRVRRPVAKLTEAHVYFALNYIARHLRRGRRVRTIGRYHYDACLERLVSEARRRPKTAATVVFTLPNASQVVTAVGSWEEALLLAGFEVSPTLSEGVRRGVPIEEAIRRYYLVTGVLPSDDRLWLFTRTFGFARTKKPDEPWRDTLDRACRYIVESGLPHPPEYRRSLAPSSFDREGFSFDGPEWSARTKWTVPAIVALIIEFVWSLPAGATASVVRYTAFRRELKDAGRLPPPAPAHLARRWKPLHEWIAEVATPGALERAVEEWDAGEEDRIAHESKQKLDRALRHPRAQTLLTLFRERGLLTPRQIEAELGWARSRQAYWCAHLHRAGLIAPTQQNLNDKTLAYFLVEPDSAPEQIAAEAAEHRQRRKLSHPHTQQLLQTLVEHGPLAPRELQQLLGWTRGRLRDRLAELVEAGQAAPTEDSGARNVAYFARDPDLSDEELAAIRGRMARQRAVQRPEVQMLYGLLVREARAISPNELKEQLDWKQTKFWLALNVLLEARMVAGTHRGSRDNVAQYFASDPQATEAEIEAQIAHWRTMRPINTPQARELLDALARYDGPVAPKTLREEVLVDWHPVKLSEWMARLLAAGLVEVVGKRGPRSQYRLVRTLGYSDVTRDAPDQNAEARSGSGIAANPASS